MNQATINHSNAGDRAGTCCPISLTIHTLGERRFGLTK
jgi:hypothetical protein